MKKVFQINVFGLLGIFVISIGVGALAVIFVMEQTQEKTATDRAEDVQPQPLLVEGTEVPPTEPTQEEASMETEPPKKIYWFASPEDQNLKVGEWVTIEGYESHLIAATVIEQGGVITDMEWESSGTRGVLNINIGTRGLSPYSDGIAAVVAEIDNPRENEGIVRINEALLNEKTVPVRVTGQIAQINPHHEENKSRQWNVLLDSSSVEVEVITVDCEGPFGIDSAHPTTHYRIGTVISKDLEKRQDGTWHIKSFWVSVGFREEHKRFRGLERYEINRGDHIGFHGYLAENISQQLIPCEVIAPNGVLGPRREFSISDGPNIRGLVVAVELGRNEDPEPHNPEDFLIDNAVIKCANGSLYVADFGDWVIGQTTMHMVGQPGQSAFGEGDIITVRQKSKLERGWFKARYIEPEK